jgi:hypothetical protein
MPSDGRNRIMIFGPKGDGTYVVVFPHLSQRLTRFSPHGADPSGQRARVIHHSRKP